MTTLDWIKLAMIGPIFFVMGPAYGMYLKGHPGRQRVAFGIMCFMTINGLLAPANWGLTLDSIETYRGHTKGYHFYFNHAIAIALIVARLKEDKKSFRWIPPGMGLYWLYCGLSTLSIVNAEQVNLVIMTLHKQMFASLLLIATFNFIRTEDDMRFFIKVMLCTMLWELFVCLKLKYLGGQYQVRGTFEHQNPLAMYSVLIGMMFLAVGLGPAYKGSNWLMIGFIACGVIVECTLSRGALVMFAAGTVGVTLLSLLEKVTARRMMLTSIMGVLGSIGLVLAIGSIVARFNDRGNAASGSLREMMKSCCVEMVRDHPLGVGWNNYALVINYPYKYSEIYYDYTREQHQPVNHDMQNAVVESHYYLLLAETGYLGLGSWLFLIFTGLWRNFLCFKAFGHSFRRCLSLGIAAGCALNYEQSTLERVLVQPRNLMIWMILGGITARLEVMRRELKTNKKAG